MKKTKISIFGFIEDKNLGDPVIGETCKFLTEKICQKNNIESKIVLYSLFPPPDYSYYRLTKFTRRRGRKNRSWLGNLYTLFVFWVYNFFSFKLKQYYEDIIKDSDIVILAGGGMIKYISQDFWVSDYYITKYCEKYNVPLYMNAMGVEGYDKNNLISRLLKSIVNKKCIKGITTRDDAISLAQYIGKPCDDLVVGDPALYSLDLYSTSQQQNIIGINTIRAGIFNINNRHIEEFDLIKFYAEFIKRLNEKGYRWQIFTNGVEYDYKLGIEILKFLNIPVTEEFIAQNPKNSQELINLISKYKGIIAGRMHADIIATSLGIPVVGLIFNDKIKWFAKHTGLSDRFFDINEMHNYDKIFVVFEKALEEKLVKQKDKISELKAKTYKGLEQFIKSEIFVDTKKNSNFK